jgi:acyl-CoA dehydrogenase
MRRDVFTEDHEQFRAQVRRFVDKEVAPKVEEWNARDERPRDVEARR